MTKDTKLEGKHPCPRATTGQGRANIDLWKNIKYFLIINILLYKLKFKIKF